MSEQANKPLESTPKAAGMHLNATGCVDATTHCRPPHPAPSSAEPPAAPSRQVPPDAPSAVARAKDLTEGDAALVVQCMWRSVSAVREVQHARDECAQNAREAQAAISIAGLYRARVARRRLVEAVHEAREREAVRRLQRGWTRTRVQPPSIG